MAWKFNPFTSTFDYYTSSSSGASTFLDLTDTPATYVGSASKYVTVKADQSGLEFSSLSAANTALSNLAAVAINTTLLPGADDGAGLGDGTHAFSDLFLASGGVINWANSDTTITHSAKTLTSTGNLVITSQIVDSALPKSLSIIPANNTAITAGTDNPQLSIAASTQQWATGAVNTATYVSIAAPTYAAVGASTFSYAVTLGVYGAPAQGANASITNALGLVVWGKAHFSTIPLPNNYFYFEAPLTTIAVSQIGVGTRFTSSLREAASGNHSIMAGVYIDTLSLTNGTATTTTAASLYVAGAPGTANNKYSLLVDAGDVRFDGRMAVGESASGIPGATLQVIKGGLSSSGEQISLLVSNYAYFMTGNLTLNRGVSISDVTFSGNWTCTTSVTCDIGRAASASVSTTFITNNYALRIGASGTVTMSNNGKPTIKYASLNVAAHGVFLNATTQITSSPFASAINLETITINQIGGAVTVDNVATLYIQSAPAAGSSVTLTNAYSIWSADGSSRFDLGAANNVWINGSTTAHTATTGSLYVTTTTATNNVVGAQVNTASTATVGQDIFGFYNILQSSAVVTGTAQNMYGIYNSLTKTGADTSVDTTTLYGVYSVVSNTGATDAGTKTTYGGYFSATGDTAGTSTAYGIYATATGADKNWAAYFAGNKVTDGWDYVKQDSVTAANDFTPTSNICYVGGGTDINRIATPVDSTKSAFLILIFASNTLVKHNQASGGGFSKVYLAYAQDFQSQAYASLALAWDAQNAEWVEFARTITI